MALDTTNEIVKKEKSFEVTNRMVLSIAVPMTLAFLSTPLLGLTDMAVVGRLDDAAMLAGLASGAIVFDVVFTTFNFLRSATTGLVAQAMGREDESEELLVLFRGLAIALVSGALLILAGPLVSLLGILFIAPEADVAEAMHAYILIRVLAAPVTLGNFVLLGYILGRGEGRVGLGLQLVLNGSNIALSVLLGLGLGWGLDGVAWATVIAETLAFLAGAILIARRYRDGLPVNWKHVWRRDEMKRMFSLSGDIMIRSFALLTAFAYMTRMGAQLGTLTLAANAILMNFFMISGYFLDGFATAAEQIVGRAIGANFRPAFDRAVKLTLTWGAGLAIALFGVFMILGPWLIDALTTIEPVRVLAHDHLLLAACCALTGVLAFQMDGVFIGATWSSDMRNMMLLSLALFFASVHILVPYIGNTGLWLALHVFLISRGLSLAVLMLKRRQSRFVV